MAERRSLTRTTTSTRTAPCCTKWFASRRRAFVSAARTANGGWIWKLGDTRRVLYRLPEVLVAAAAGERVFVTEGEKDADALVRAGAVATTNPGGAGKWRREYAEALRGAEVVVVADRDAAGLAHARQVEASLRTIAASVAVVEAVEGKDASDHLATGHTPEEFLVIESRGGVSAPEATWG